MSIVAWLQILEKIFEMKPLYHTKDGECMEIDLLPFFQGLQPSFRPVKGMFVPHNFLFLQLG
jgi:hypothetical protein